MMIFWKRKLLLLSIALCSPLSYAANLLEVYQQAQQFDPAFQAAYFNYMAQRESYPQALSALLPLINATGNQSANSATFSGNSGGGNSTSSFGSYNYALNLSQPVFNFAAWTTLRSASASVKQAQATYDAATQDLMIRTAKAYFAVLQAEDTLGYTLAEKRANAKQLDQATQRYKVGLDPITSVDDAKSRYDTTVATEIAARTTLENSRETLREITGEFYTDLARLGKKLPLINPTPGEPNAWVKTAENQNYTLLSARYASIAAREAIKTNFAGHLPTLNVVASYTDTKGDSGISTSGSTDLVDTASNGSSFISKNKAVGLQIAVPIYQGGAVNSQTRQARYEYKKTVADLDRTHRSVVSSTRQNFNNVISGISQVKADQQAIISARSALSSTEESFKVGTRTFVDVLNAQRDLYLVQRQSAQDQYTYLNSILILKQAAGTLSLKDLAIINSWLTAHQKQYS